MARFYSVIDLSENISRTPEGYLACNGAVLARAGDLIYAEYETGVGDSSETKTVNRSIEEICNPETMASFEGKPLTLGHPEDGAVFVGPGNWKELTVGTINNVRQGEGEDSDKLIADILVTDKEAIYSVETKLVRQLSCGYEVDFIELDSGDIIQKNIIGNHVALVQAGRCGSECSIVDSAIKVERKMTRKEKFMKLITKAVDEEMPEDTDTSADGDVNIADQMKSFEARLSALEGKGADEDVASPDDKDADATDADQEEEAPDNRLDKIEQVVMKILSILNVDQDDGVVAEDECATKAMDSDTLSRAEILAPGIESSKDIKEKALKAAYSTDVGKKVIDSALCGKDFEKADTDLLFVAASESMKRYNMETHNTTSASIASDARPMVVDAAKALQDINTKFWSNQGESAPELSGADAIDKLNKEHYS